MSKRVAPTLTDDQYDRLLIHAHREKHTMTTMAQILIEEGLDLRDRDLEEEETRK